MKNYKRLMQSVVIQAIKDYVVSEFKTTAKVKDDKLVKTTKRVYPHKAEVSDWVNKMSGTFHLCAASMDMTSEALQEMMLEKMDKINRGQKVINRRY